MTDLIRMLGKAASLDIIVTSGLKGLDWESDDRLHDDFIGDCLTAIKALSYTPAQISQAIEFALSEGNIDEDELIRRHEPEECSLVVREALNIQGPYHSASVEEQKLLLFFCLVSSEAYDLIAKVKGHFH